MHECRCLRKPGTGISSLGTGVAVVVSCLKWGNWKSLKHSYPLRLLCLPRIRPRFVLIFKLLEIGRFIRNDFCSIMRFGFITK